MKNAVEQIWYTKTVCENRINSTKISFVLKLAYCAFLCSFLLHMDQLVVSARVVPGSARASFQHSFIFNDINNIETEPTQSFYNNYFYFAHDSPHPTLSEAGKGF